MSKTIFKLTLDFLVNLGSGVEERHNLCVLSEVDVPFSAHQFYEVLVIHNLVLIRSLFGLFPASFECSRVRVLILVVVFSVQSILVFFIVSHHSTKVLEFDIDILPTSLSLDLSIRFELERIDQSRPEGSILKLSQIQHFFVGKQSRTTLIQFLELFEKLQQLFFVKLRVHHNLLNITFLEIFGCLLGQLNDLMDDCILGRV